MSLVKREALLSAANNVDWYRTIVGSHGYAGEVASGIWLFRGAPPPYHSNAVTLSPDGIDAQYRTLHELRLALGGPFSFKDSFSVLDMTALGFRPLFEAEWIWRDPTPDASAPRGWRRAASNAELEAWEEGLRNNGSPADRRAFLPALLADDSLAFLTLRRDDRIVAGCAANRSAEVVGFSNFFSIEAPDDRLAGSALAAVSAFAPGLPIVGYERGESLAQALRLGFRPVGPLRVWIAGDA